MKNTLLKNTLFAILVIASLIVVSNPRIISTTIAQESPQFFSGIQTYVIFKFLFIVNVVWSNNNVYTHSRLVKNIEISL